MPTKLVVEWKNTYRDHPLKAHMEKAIRQFLVRKPFVQSQIEDWEQINGSAILTKTSPALCGLHLDDHFDIIQSDIKAAKIELRFEEITP